MSHTYKPGFLADEQMREELARLQKAMNEPQPEFTLQVLHATPKRTFAGQVIYADGSDFNPGAGEGIYRRNKANSAWDFCGPGFATGSGGTVTQATSKATGVTLDRACGTITLNAAALASQTTVSFTLTDALIAANDLVIVTHTSAGTLGAYNFATTPAAGSVSIAVRNLHTGSLSEAIVLRFAVIKAVVA